MGFAVYGVRNEGGFRATVDVEIEGVRRQVRGFEYPEENGTRRVSFSGVGAYVGKSGTKIWNCEVTIINIADPAEAKEHHVRPNVWYVNRLSNGRDYRADRYARTVANSIRGWFDTFPEAVRSRTR